MDLDAYKQELYDQIIDIIILSDTENDFVEKFFDIPIEKWSIRKLQAILKYMKKIYEDEETQTNTLWNILIISDKLTKSNSTKKVSFNIKE